MAAARADQEAAVAAMKAARAAAGKAQRFCTARRGCGMRRRVSVCHAAATDRTHDRLLQRSRTSVRLLAKLNVVGQPGGQRRLQLELVVDEIHAHGFAGAGPHTDSLVLYGLPLAQHEAAEYLRGFGRHRLVHRINLEAAH
eukprot:6535404-Prymnesium_polylepis.1